MSRSRISIYVLTTLTVALIGLTSFARAGESAPTSPLELLREHRVYGQPNPDAPQELSQYAFLIGDWSCTTKFLTQDGKTYNEGTADWIGVYVLNGYAIQDYWIGNGPQGKKFYGTNIRSYDRAKGKWLNRWLPAGTLQWKSFESELVNDTMVMTGGEGTSPRGDFIDRNTFYDIGPNSWRWRKDRSFDKGKTWVEGIGFIEAKRKN